MSKNRRVNAVKAPSGLDPLDFLARCRRAAQLHGFRPEALATVEGCELLALTRRRRGIGPRIYLSSGIHGDEPAPPEALLSLIEHGHLDDRATWFLVPLLNPSGFRQRTRENGDSVDLNRDYRDPRSAEVRAHIHWLERQPPFDLTICLHEDWESNGFYLYELNPLQRHSLAGALINGARQHMPIDVAAMIDGRPVAEVGIIRPEADPLQRELWPEAIYLRAHHTTLSYTIETASALPLAQRVRTHVAAVRAALDEFLARWPKL